MFRRCVFLFIWKQMSGRNLSGTDVIPKYKKTPGRPHFDKEQKGNMFPDCDAMYVT